nr:hypothetical protein [Sedimentitalea sp. CY04]
MLLASCETTGNGVGTAAPAAVQEIAAPNQDLENVRIDPEDGCYTYRHVGPVETTYLPLRTTEGSPICTRQPEAEAEQPTST